MLPAKNSLFPEIFSSRSFPRKSRPKTAPQFEAVIMVGLRRSPLKCKPDVTRIDTVWSIAARALAFSSQGVSEPMQLYFFQPSAAWIIYRAPNRNVSVGSSATDRASSKSGYVRYAPIGTKFRTAPK
jgi:hypothetical protein